MKKFFSTPALLLLCFAASVTACKQSNATLQPASYIHTSNPVVPADPLSGFYSFSEYDLVYFLITKNGAAVYVSER